MINGTGYLLAGELGLADVMTLQRQHQLASGYSQRDIWWL
jgi:hypothetical protein